MNTIVEMILTIIGALLLVNYREIEGFFLQTLLIITGIVIMKIAFYIGIS